MHISLFSLTLLGSALLSLGCMVQGSTSGIAGAKRTSREVEEQPPPKRTTQPDPELEFLDTFYADEESKKVIEEVKKTLNTIAEDLDSYDLGAVGRLLRLEEGYKLVCRTFIDACFDHTIGSTDHTSRVKEIYNFFKDAVAQGKFADSRGFLTKVLESLKSAVKSLDQKADRLTLAKDTDTFKALEALRKNEQARNEIIEIFAQIMMDRGNFRPIEQLETPQGIAGRLMLALATFNNESISDALGVWVDELIYTLCGSDKTARGVELSKRLSAAVAISL